MITLNIKQTIDNEQHEIFTLHMKDRERFLTLEFVNALTEFINDFQLKGKKK